MKPDVSGRVEQILAGYDSNQPRVAADRLRGLWLEFEPKSIEVIKAELREQQETAGIPVPVLKAIGKEVGKAARKHLVGYIPLVRLLWNDYGREGKGIAVAPLGAMELVDPETIIPMITDLCRSCVTWEDADRLAMDALEPIVRSKPAEWLGAMEAWLVDENKWVRRAGVTVVGRLPMKHPSYTGQCLRLVEGLLLDTEVDVRKATSFAIRLAARGDTAYVRDFLARNVPPADSAATWVLCDAIRSMARKLLPEFVSLLPVYEEWASDPASSARDRRSIQSAVKILMSVRALPRT